MALYGRLLIILFVLSASSSASAQNPEVGSETMITLKRETVSKLSSGSGRSNTRNALIEVVLAKSDAEVELEYRLPPGSEGRADPVEWMFPVQVRKTLNGEVEILNQTELSLRRDEWLDAAPQFRRVCGQSIFTWTAIQIYCETSDVLGILAPFDLWIWTLAPGLTWEESGTIASQPLKLVGSETDVRRYEVNLDLDPEALRRSDAEGKVSVATMTGKPVPTLEEALGELSTTSYMGTLVLGFQTDVFGAVLERTWVRETTKFDPSGQSSSRVSTTTVRRAPLP